MTEFRMPDSYYDPPEYDGCEDCLCEDPEHPEIVCNLCEALAHFCPPFSDHDEYHKVCVCKCHNLPQEPEGDDDGRTPYHLMDGYGEDSR